MNPYYKTKHYLWTPEEIETLKQNYPTHSLDKLQELLPNRTREAISSRAKSLGIKKIVPSFRYKKPTFYQDKIYKFPFKGKTIKFGVIGDTHLISKHQQITALKKFYKIAEKEKCKLILHTGDLTEGNGQHYLGQVQEIFEVLMGRQMDYALDVYPRDLPTYIISGDHDLDWWKIGAGDIVEEIAKRRIGMNYLGQHGAYFKLGKVNIYLMHPMGGMAYAISYKPQKFAEGFAGGEKPQILLIGHYHQTGYFFYRNIHILLTGCFQSQTPYFVRKGWYPKLGGWVVEIEVDKEGSILKFKPEFYPVYQPIKNDF